MNINDREFEKGVTARKTREDGEDQRNPARKVRETQWVRRGLGERTGSDDSSVFGPVTDLVRFGAYNAALQHTEELLDIGLVAEANCAGQQRKRSKTH